MKTRQLIVLFSVLALLILLAVWQKREVLFKSPDTDKPQLLFADFDPEQATRIQLTKPDQETIIIKQDDKWLLSTDSNVPANAELVTKLLDQIGQIPKGDLVSQQPDKFSLFQVDESGLAVNITDDAEKTLVNFYLGKQGVDFNNLYFRVAGTDDVLLINQNLQYIFDQFDWQNKRGFEFDPDEALELNLAYDDQSFSLLKNENNWRLIKPEEAPAQKKMVDSILKGLNDLRITEYADGQDVSSHGLDNPSFKIRVTLAGGVVVIVFCDKKDFNLPG